jgi:DNA-binding NtrC family response regulator
MGPTPYEPPTILIADDDELIRVSLRFALERQGYRVVEAPTTRELLDVARVERPAVCILDVQMPGVNLAFRLSSLRSLDPDMRFVVLSGLATLPVALVDLEMQHPLVPFLRKPVDLATFTETVASVMREVASQPRR